MLGWRVGGPLWKVSNSYRAKSELPFGLTNHDDGRTQQGNPYTARVPIPQGSVNVGSAAVNKRRLIDPLTTRQV